MRRINWGNELSRLNALLEWHYLYGLFVFETECWYVDEDGHLFAIIA